MAWLSWLPCIPKQATLSKRNQRFDLHATTSDAEQQFGGFGVLPKAKALSSAFPIGKRCAGVPAGACEGLGTGKGLGTMH
jgi:hypothetical protein